MDRIEFLKEAAVRVIDEIALVAKEETLNEERKKEKEKARGKLFTILGWCIDDCLETDHEYTVQFLKDVMSDM